MRLPSNWKRRSTQQHAREGEQVGTAPWIAERVQRGKGGRNETEDVTWGPRDSQVLPKYEKIKGVALKGTKRDGISK